MPRRMAVQTALTTLILQSLEVEDLQRDGVPRRVRIRQVLLGVGAFGEKRSAHLPGWARAGGAAPTENV
jgi:hypothetical protein